jgi:hypothetical protein
LCLLPESLSVFLGGRAMIAHFADRERQCAKWLIE